MLQPSAALRRILSHLTPIAPLPAERVPLLDALGRALAEEVRTERPLPAFDRSEMDGYALRGADVPSAGARLPIAFEIFTGGKPPPALPPGSCCRIFTGAPLPAGADAVEMQEQVRRNRGQAIFNRPGEPGRFVQPAGSDLSAGEVALPAGRVLDPGALGLAASLGRSQLLVHRRPRVAILATGDELSPVDRPLGRNQIIDSNSHALAGACIEAGAVPLLLPIAGDRIEALQAGIEAARGSDLLVTSGGVSVGAKDLVRDALHRAGARLHLWRVAVRPGKPFAFGLWGRTAVFGLPGNPASALVTFELFVRPALRALAGLRGAGRTMITGRLTAPTDKPIELTVYLRTRAHWRGDDLWLTPLATQRSGHATSITGFEALAVLPKGATHLGKGARVEALLVAPPGALADNPPRSDR